MANMHRSTILSSFVSSGRSTSDFFWTIHFGSYREWVGMNTTVCRFILIFTEYSIVIVTEHLALMIVADCR